MIKNFEKDVIKGSFLGFFIGDALGVPVEFSYREVLKNKPVKDMQEYGSHHQPKGTWSDDSSMVLATIDGLIKSEIPTIDFKCIMMNFLKWKQNGEYTPHNEVFDIGRTTNLSLRKYQENIQNNKEEDFLCGFNSQDSNGNGSLMRILPVAFYLYYMGIEYTSNKFFDIIKQISSMTHAHIYSILGCYIYSAYVIELLKTKDKSIAYNNLRNNLKKLSKTNDNLKEIKNIYGRIIYDDISKLSSNEIKSSGYIVDTLEASIWSILTSNNFEDSVLKAVNLGDDTDTIGALTGGLAGIIYSDNFFKDNNIKDLYDSETNIESLYGFSKWVNELQKITYLNTMIEKFTKYLSKIFLLNIKLNEKLIEETINYIKYNPNKNYIEAHKDAEIISNFDTYIRSLFIQLPISSEEFEKYSELKNESIVNLNYYEIIIYIFTCFCYIRPFLYEVYIDGRLLKALERLYYLCLNNTILDKDIKKIENSKSNGNTYAELSDKEYKKMSLNEKKQFNKIMSKLKKLF